MRIPVEQIEAAPKHLAYAEESAELNHRLDAGPHDLTVRGPLAVDLTYYRAGLDVVFEGTIDGAGDAVCARCAEAFSLPLSSRFRVVLSPRAVMEQDSQELTADDLGFGFYDGDEIEVTALVHEHALLSLPTRLLCADACRGLCPQCGANLNVAACACSTEPQPPRLAVLRDLVQARRGQN
ncbi:MAG TPA: DUF177 domain-containing protein [Candidatus Limnocylindria bacterium]|nr:DUF177 domain-containing protein [Candidatus Limnocylindria bacterium]